MLLTSFGLISGFLSVVTYVPYLNDIFKLTTKPQRATWFIWSVLSGIAFVAQITKGATDSLWLVGVQTIGVVIVFLLSLRYGVGGLTKKDIGSLCAAGLGLLLWYVTSDAAVALVIAVCIDAVAGMLTLLKAYEHPDTETLSTWVLSGTAGIFGALAVGTFNFVLLLFPLYIVLINYAIAGAIIYGRRKHQISTH